MNKNKVLNVVNDVIYDKLTQLIEELSTNEFIDMVKDKLVEEGIKFDEDKDTDKIFDIVGGRIVPLLTKMTEFVIDKEIKLN